MPFAKLNGRRRWIMLLAALGVGLLLFLAYTTSMPSLKVGDRAPDFTATTSVGRTIRLSDYVGQQGLVLFFYPADNTPVCTAEACSFRDSYEKFAKAGAEVVGISGDTDESHNKFAEQHRLSFPLVSDKDGSLRKLFGVSKFFGLMPGRVTYVIDKEGIVRLTYSAMFASDEHVRQALAVLEPAHP